MQGILGGWETFTSQFKTDLSKQSFKVIYFINNLIKSKRLYQISKTTLRSLSEIFDHAPTYLLFIIIKCLLFQSNLIYSFKKCSYNINCQKIYVGTLIYLMSESINKFKCYTYMLNLIHYKHHYRTIN